MATESLSEVPRLGPIFVRSALSRGQRPRTLPSTRLVLSGQEVDRGRLADYQRLCGFPLGDTLPPTYPHIVGFALQAELMARRDFPLPLAGMVHLANIITVHRRLTAEDRLTLTVYPENLADHPKGRTVDLVTLVDVEDHRVWEGRSTYLARGVPHPDATRQAEPPGIPRAPAVAQWRLPGDLGRRYAAVSGDVNPIHLSPLTAKLLGFPRAIAHGMWTYARVLSALGPATSAPGTSQVWFRKPVYLPSAVELVIAKDSGRTAAALRSPRDRDTVHLVLTHEPV